MNTLNEEKLIAIHSLSEIPTTFTSEDEEREWWAKHYIDDALYEQLEDRTESLRKLIGQKCATKEKT
jgi:hypothetical protein